MTGDAPDKRPVIVAIAGPNGPARQPSSIPIFGKLDCGLSTPAIRTLPVVLVFDNDELAAPFRKVAEFRDGKMVFQTQNIPHWFLTASKNPGVSRS